jgi:hypothetical protein
MSLRVNDWLWDEAVIRSFDVEGQLSAAADTIFHPLGLRVAYPEYDN